LLFYCAGLPAAWEFFLFPPVVYFTSLSRVAIWILERRDGYSLGECAALGAAREEGADVEEKGD
jgi:hypothetical protein